MRGRGTSAEMWRAAAKMPSSAATGMTTAPADVRHLRRRHGRQALQPVPFRQPRIASN